MIKQLITVASFVRAGVAFSVRRPLYNSPSILGAKYETVLLTRGFATVGSKEIEVDNEMHRKHYTITGVGQRSKVTCNTNTNHTLEADVPKKMGGGDEAPQPVEHLLAALVGCTQATAVYVGRMMKPQLPTIPARLQSVSGSVAVHFKNGVEVSEEQLRILGRQTEARCPVANMMHASGCIMDIQWKNGADIH
eukprot:scaffold7430_cov156-Skeletonema_dohrnii-CCMP3373.AAC.5